MPELPKIQVLHPFLLCAAHALPRAEWIDTPAFQILGVQAGMTRAIEYLSLDVTERLHRSRATGRHPPETNRSPGEPPDLQAEDEWLGEK